MLFRHGICMWEFINSFFALRRSNHCRASDFRSYLCLTASLAWLIAWSVCLSDLRGCVLRSKLALTQANVCTPSTFCWWRQRHLLPSLCTVLRTLRCSLKSNCGARSKLCVASAECRAPLISQSFYNMLFFVWLKICQHLSEMCL